MIYKIGHIDCYVFWLYLAIAIVSFFGFILFIWWWKKAGKPSEIYIYFTLLLASEAFFNFTNAFARYLWATGDIVGYRNLVENPLWLARIVFHLIVLSIIVGKVFVRILSTLRKARRFKLEN